MRKSKELVILLVLLFSAMAFVLWYVIDRRAKNRATPPAAITPTLVTGPMPAGPQVDLTKTERKTVDFSSGKPVVKDSAEDQAAIDAALKDMAGAADEVTFESTKKPKP